MLNYNKLSFYVDIFHITLQIYPHLRYFFACLYYQWQKNPKKQTLTFKEHLSIYFSENWKSRETFHIQYSFKSMTAVL